MNINLDMVLVIQSILYKGVSHQFDSKPHKTCTPMGSSVQIYSIHSIWSGVSGVIQAKVEVCHQVWDS